MILKQALALVVSTILFQNAFACDEGFESFKATVYPKIRQDCIKCHNGQKPDAPAFAGSDPFKSYDQLSSYMNFTKIEESQLVIRAGNGHCGLETCEENSGAEMLELAKKWVDGGEIKCDRNGKFFTPEQSLPSALPTAAEGFKTLKFPLDSISAELKGMTFYIDIQNYLNSTESAKGAFRLRAPRIVGGKNSIFIKDVKVLINGRFDPIYNEYSGINRVIPFFPVKMEGATSATPILSGQTMIVLKDDIQNPKISISFVAIETKTDVPTCESVDRFKSLVMPLIGTYNCQSCHQANGDSLGKQIFNAKLSADKLCQVSSALLDPSYVMISPLVTVPLKGLVKHPQLTEAQSYEYVNAVRNWLNK